jgi:hypothetical protein
MRPTRAVTDRVPHLAGGLDMSYPEVPDQLFLLGLAVVHWRLYGHDWPMPPDTSMMRYAAPGQPSRSRSRPQALLVYHINDAIACAATHGLVKPLPLNTIAFRQTECHNIRELDTVHSPAPAPLNRPAHNVYAPGHVGSCKQTGRGCLGPMGCQEPSYFIPLQEQANTDVCQLVCPRIGWA